MTIYEVRQNDASGEPWGSRMVNDRYVNRASEALKTQMDCAFACRLLLYKCFKHTLGMSTLYMSRIRSFPLGRVDGRRPRHSRIHVTRSDGESQSTKWQIVIKRSLHPRKTIKCQFLCSGANNTMYGMGTGHSSTASPSDKSFCTATCHIRYHIATARLVWHDESWRIALCSPISYLCHHILVIINSSLIASKC
jgi:hypothetical protein